MTHRQAPRQICRQPRRLTALLLLGAAGLCVAGPGVTAGNAFLDEPGRPDPRQGPAAAPSSQWVRAVQGPPPARRADRIGAQDLLRVRVFQADELSTEARVDGTGQIALPLLGAVPVAGLTPAEAAALIAARLRKDYMRDPRVEVAVVDPAPREITVLGAVRRSGVYRLQDETTLLGAIALAQGFDPLAKESGVILFRKDPSGRPVAYVVDAGAVQRGQSADPTLQGGDRVVVPRSGGAVLLKGAADTLRALLRVPY